MLMIDKNITIVVLGGVVIDVINLPPGYTYTVEAHD